MFEMGSVSRCLTDITNWETGKLARFYKITAMYIQYLYNH